MLLVLETPAGKKLLVQGLGKHDKVNTLKHKIQLEEGTPPTSQRLFAHSQEGAKLEYGKALGDYGLKDGSTVIMLHPHGMRV